MPETPRPASSPSFDTGFVPPALDGVALTTVALEETRQHSVQMTAYNDAGESVRSNQIVVAAVAPVCDARLCDDRNPCTRIPATRWAASTRQSGMGRCATTATSTPSTTSASRASARGCCCPVGPTTTATTATSATDPRAAAAQPGAWRARLCTVARPTACTAPRCDPSAGCVSDLQPDGTPCNDGVSETWDDVCLGGTCQGTWPDAGPDLAIESLSPEIVSPGRHTIEVYGSGFVPGAVLSFVNGKGRRPQGQVRSARG